MATRNTYFISHGGATLRQGDTPVRRFYQNFTKAQPDRPEAILMVSALWDTPAPVVSTAVRNSMIDKSVGSSALQSVSYTPPGAPAVGRRTMQLLQEAGFHVSEDKERRLDAGAWMPLSLMYPEADIPVFQLSVQSHRNAAYHYKLGQALQLLKGEGVMIVGSGNMIYNNPVEYMLSRLSDITPGISLPGGPWTKEFDDFVRQALFDGRFEDVIDYESKLPYAKKAHPSNQDFVPLLVALGAAKENPIAELIHTS